MATTTDIERAAELGIFGLALLALAVPFLIIRWAWRLVTRWDYEQQ